VESEQLSTRKAKDWSIRVTDKDKTELKKEILLEEHEAIQELGLCKARVSGVQADFEVIAQSLKSLVSHIGDGMPNPQYGRDMAAKIIAKLQKYGLADIETTCKDMMAAHERSQRAIQRKREAGMI